MAHIKLYYNSLGLELLEDRNFVIILLIKGKAVQLAIRMHVGGGGGGGWKLKQKPQLADCIMTHKNRKIL